MKIPFAIKVYIVTQNPFNTIHIIFKGIKKHPSQPLQKKQPLE